LIRNSIQAEATEIKFDFKTIANEIELRVSDNGKGINKEDFEKIFEPNFTTKKDGMGLGLSMARRYLKSTGAEINVDYSSVDGTVIKLTFPKLV
jgi:signal transduction histidine kinase